MCFGIVSLKAQKGNNSDQKLPSDNTKYAYGTIIPSRHFLRKGAVCLIISFFKVKCIEGCIIFYSDTTVIGQIWMYLSTYLIKSTLGELWLRYWDREILLYYMKSNHTSGIQNLLNMTYNKWEFLKYVTFPKWSRREVC